MITPSNPETAIAPIALTADEGEALWAFGGLVLLKSTASTTGGRVMVSEQRVPRGCGSPLHVHHREDEWFYVIDGAVTFWVGGDVIEAPAGSFVYGPRDVPHTFVVSSDDARFLLVTEPGGFEDFMRAMGRPAESLTVPPPEPPPADLSPIIAAAAEYGIDIIGPPGIPA